MAEIKPPRTHKRKVVAAKGSAKTTLARILWATFFVILIGGGAWWSARTWLHATANQPDSSLFLPPVLLGTFTPAEVKDLDTLTETAEVLAGATATATTANGSCSVEIDPLFQAKIAELSTDVANGFACPTAIAQDAEGEWLAFEQGGVVVLADSPLVYIAYADGKWETVPNPQPQSITDTVAALVAGDERQAALGKALPAQASQSDTVLQTFAGGVALGRKTDGRVLLLSNSNLRQ